MREAPLYVHAHDLARWVLANVGGDGALTRRLHEGALALLDAVVLALKGDEREVRLTEADDANALLRVHVRLARELGLVDDRRLLFLTRELDSIGRQIGGWLRRLDRDTLPARHR